MNKEFFSILLSVLLITNISACTVVPPKNTADSIINEQYETANTEKSPMESKNGMNDSDDTEQSIVVKMYKETLYDFMNGINPFETVDWVLNTNPSLSFAIVDMGGDDFPELIVYNLDNYGEHLVLHYVSEKSYFITPQFGFRGMYNIMKDGTFSWNQRAGTEYGAAKLKFDGSSVDYIELYMIRNDGTDEVEFFIGDQKVTLEELNAFSSQFSNERAEFYELTEENIEKYVTLEIFIHK